MYQDGDIGAATRRLRELERELAELHAVLAAAPRGRALPGTFLVVALGPHRALVPAAHVQQLLRMVALQPVAGAEGAVLGSFVHRGTPTLAVDLAALIGVQRAPALDAHLLVLAASRPLALVTDRVEALVEAPVLAEVDEGLQARGGGLWAGFCQAGADHLPLLSVPALLARLEGGSR